MTPRKLEVTKSISLPVPAEIAYDYLCNPNSWVEWLATSEKIIAEDRPLKRGETFDEIYRAATGNLDLHWRVMTSEPHTLWEVHTKADMAGPIEILYLFMPTEDGCTFSRRLTLPAFPGEPTKDQLAALDAEATESLERIQAILAKRHSN